MPVRAASNKKSERSIWRQADVVLYPSPKESAVVRSASARGTAIIIPCAYEDFGDRLRPPNNRETCLSPGSAIRPCGRAAVCLIKSLGRADLLILDDFGLEPLDAGARHDLLEILEERYGRRSTIVTSQLPLSAWHEVIGDPTYADAILDRLVHNAHRIDLTGESLRRTRGKQSKTA